MAPTRFRTVSTAGRSRSFERVVDVRHGNVGGRRVRRNEECDAGDVQGRLRPDCRGRFELTANALRLAIGASSRTTFYSFTCPDCGAAVRKPAGERIVELLTGGGVRTLRLHSTL